MTRSTAASSRPDPAWLDRQYNNRELVPEHATHFARWAKDSAQARQTLPGLLDVAYGHGPSETLDVFPAPRKRGQPPAPVLVFIHGGYWRSLDKSDHSFIAPAFVRHGACVVVPNYALCPAVTIPQIALQMAQALAWVYRHIGAHGGDPQRITVVGHSAGGHLAAMLLACQWPLVGEDLPEALVQNALAISGVFDLEPLRHTPFLKDSLRLTAQQVRQVVGEVPEAQIHPVETNSSTAPSNPSSSAAPRNSGTRNTRIFAIALSKAASARANAAIFTTQASSPTTHRCGAAPGRDIPKGRNTAPRSASHRVSRSAAA